MKPFTPQIGKLEKRTVLTMTTVGDPKKIMPKTMQALYGSAYGTKFKVFKPLKKKMEIGALSAFWPDAHKKPRSKWTAIWQLEVSPFVKQKDVVQKLPETPVKVQVVPAAKIAQTLYIGVYSAEGPTIQALHAFIKAQKLKMVGLHEEVYLTKPGKKAKTIIRYVVR